MFLKYSIIACVTLESRRDGMFIEKSLHTSLESRRDGMCVETPYIPKVQAPAAFYVTFFVVLHSDCYKGGYAWFRMM